MIWANLLGVRFLNTILKSIYTRERPELEQILAANYYSFPSGHSMNSFAFYSLMAVLLSSMVHNKICKIAIFLSAFAVIILIGLSRIYLGVHFPLDVLAGFVAGAAWVALLLGVVKAFNDKSGVSN
jgi:undecaprenyl-diphosphatase